MQLELDINGATETVDVSKSDVLLDVLRRNGYTGAKRGCDTGACGFCTVQIDGEPTMSCVTPVTKVQDASIETIEGLGEQDDLHPVQEAFVDNSALQCGFCIPGMIMRSKALLEENADPSEQEVREALSDNLCRCTGYKKIVEAVQDAADRMDDDQALVADGGDFDSASCTPGCCDRGGEP